MSGKQKMAFIQEMTEKKSEKVFSRSILQINVTSTVIVYIKVGIPHI